ncbi:predicted protein [Histoplasma capsulatum var. duboisii H88]|uniref:Predicted protein n=1 Tax=Ajellomyces capsulatus (strain H88) TaxID=544711 RepID=F0U540_AJEC8|nr:predicted protein [Histoplasma capsulatum var. duboisii H88]
MSLLVGGRLKDVRCACLQARRGSRQLRLSSGTGQSPAAALGASVARRAGPTSHRPRYQLRGMEYEGRGVGLGLDLKLLQCHKMMAMVDAEDILTTAANRALTSSCAVHAHMEISHSHTTISIYLMRFQFTGEQVLIKYALDLHFSMLIWVAQRTVRESAV